MSSVTGAVSFDSIVTASPGELNEAFGGLHKITTEQEKRRAVDSAMNALTRLYYTRSFCEDLLRGHTLSLVPGTSKSGLDILIEPAIPLSAFPGWARVTGANRETTPPMSRVQFFSYNSKMACPSFALAAGGPEIGGTCPGASRGQVITLGLKGKPQHREGFDVDEHRMHDTICNHCYAAVGQSFQNSSNQIAQLARQYYLEGAGKKRYVTVLQAAIDAQIERKWDLESFPGYEEPSRYFRLHDSGDFYDEDYARAWIAIAENNPTILFWAPTRTHVVQSWVAFWKKHRLPPNLIVRPSSYHFDDPPPERIKGTDLAKGATSLYQISPGVPNESRADLVCPVYYAEGGDSHSCTTAKRNPQAPGEVGCRECWFDRMTINYTAH